MNPTEDEKHRFLILWLKKADADTKERIRQRFNIPRYETLNGFSPIEVSDEDMPVLEETARRGFISLKRDVKWCKNGEVYAFTSCKK
jgi:hypothetical protein